MTVWYGFHAGGVNGPYFFVDENERHATVNGERYRAMLEDYLWPELDKLDINDMWFQQDGAASHTSRVTIDLLKGKFGEYTDNPVTFYQHIFSTQKRKELPNF